MAKDRHHLKQPFHKQATNSNGDNGKLSRAESQVEGVLQSRIHSGVETPREQLQKLSGSEDLKYPLILVDGRDHAWVVPSASSGSRKCFGHFPELASFLGHYLFKKSENDNLEQGVLGDFVMLADRLEHGIDRELGIQSGDRHFTETVREKGTPDPVDSSPVKRRRSTYVIQENENSECADDDEEEFVDFAYELQDVQISSIEGVMVEILKRLQQKGLKQVEKAWLKHCHPQKQASFPYNGGKFQEQRRLNGDPGYDDKNPGLLTAPDYWPDQRCLKFREGRIAAGVRHKEPDHILKRERLTLALHILHAGSDYKDADFSIDKLEEATAKITEEHAKDFPPDAAILLQSLYYARRKEIEYEDGAIDGDTIVYVNIPDKNPSNLKRKTRSGKMRKKLKQETPETSSLFELATSLDSPPTAMSSFTSTSKEPITFDSGGTSPLEDYLPPHPHTILLDTHGAIERIDSQASSRPSGPSTTDAESLGKYRSSKNTPPRSKRRTKFDILNGIRGTDQNLTLAASQSLTPRLVPQYRHVIEHPKAVAKTTANLRPVSLSRAAPKFHHGVPGLEESNQHCNFHAPEQQVAASPSYINPTDVYMQHPFPNTAVQATRPGYNDTITSNYTNITNAPTTFIPYTPNPRLHRDANGNTTKPPPLPLPMVEAAPPISPAIITIGNPLLLHQAAGHPSATSSDFNGAIPTDPDWQIADFQWDYNHDGTYQSEHQQLDPDRQEQQPQLQKMFWATEYDAMTHNPARLAVQPSQRSGNVVATTPQMLE